MNHTIGIRDQKDTSLGTEIVVTSGLIQSMLTELIITLEVLILSMTPFGPFSAGTRVPRQRVRSRRGPRRHAARPRRGSGSGEPVRLWFAPTSGNRVR